MNKPILVNCPASNTSNGKNVYNNNAEFLMMILNRTTINTACYLIKKFNVQLFTNPKKKNI